LITGGVKEMNRLDVKTSKLQLITIILLGLFFVPIGLWNLISGLSRNSVVPIGLGIMSLAIYVPIVWLFVRAYYKSVKYFSDEGLVRNDGRNFVWTELSGVVDQFRINTRNRNAKVLWRIEIQFKNGESAWVIPMKVGNYSEVSEYVYNLPCVHKEVIV
jgi:hypothetical protein